MVTLTQELMQILPADSTLEVEAFLLNQAIGFVQLPHGAEVKIDTFNFNKFGVIDGELAVLSNNAIANSSLKASERARRQPTYPLGILVTT